MGTKRTSKGGWVDSRKLPRGSTGRALCRWCNTEVPKGRRSFCSDNCVHEHKLRTDPGYLRARVWERDKGICAVCGCDTEKVARILRHAALHYEKQRTGFSIGSFYNFNHDAKELLDKIGLGDAGSIIHSGKRWQADHVVPVAEGGGECGLENMRTLCTPCHLEATRALRQRIKRNH